METKEFKRITKYDEFTVDEFVKAFNEAEEEFKTTISDRDNKIAEVDAKIEELNSKNTRKMSPEEKESHKAEKEELRKEKSGYGKEKTQAKNYFAKYEKEKARIHDRLSKDIEKIEGQIKEKQAEIKNHEDEIKANEEKLDNMDKKLPEYDELVMNNRALERKITSLRGAITKYEAKIVLKKESQGNLEKNKHLGLKQNIKNEPRRENKKYKTSGERYKEYLEAKAKRTGYYADARTAEEDASFRTLAEEEQKIKDRKKAELEKKAKENKEKAEQPKVIVAKPKTTSKDESAKQPKAAAQKTEPAQQPKATAQKTEPTQQPKTTAQKTEPTQQPKTTTQKTEPAKPEESKTNSEKSNDGKDEFKDFAKEILGDVSREVSEEELQKAIDENTTEPRKSYFGDYKDFYNFEKEGFGEEEFEKIEEAKEKRNLFNRARGYFKQLGEKLKGIRSKLRPDKEIQEETPEEIIEEKSETEKLEEEIKKSAARMREYRENGFYDQQASEHEYYNSLVSKYNNLKNNVKEETVSKDESYKDFYVFEEEGFGEEEFEKIEQELMQEKGTMKDRFKKFFARFRREETEPVIEEKSEAEKLKEEIEKSAARMKEYRETGNYNQQALEHQYYNELISKYNNLKDGKQEETIVEDKSSNNKEKGTMFNKVKGFFGRIGKAIEREIDILEARLGITKALPESTTKESEHKTGFVPKATVNEEKAIKEANAKSNEQRNKEEVTK